MKSTKRQVRAPKITETQVQKQVAAYLAKVGGLGGYAMAIHIRNEQSTAWGRITAIQMGIKLSIPDWAILNGLGSIGFIEQKRPGWKARTAKTGNYTEHEQAQLALHKQLRLGGYWVEICETLEEWLEACRKHNVPLRSESITAERIRRGIENVMAEGGE